MIIVILDNNDLKNLFESKGDPRQRQMTPEALVHRWVEDTAVTGPEYVTTLYELREHFQTWCADEELLGLTPVAFYSAMLKLGFTATTIKDNGTFHRAFRGISLEPVGQEETFPEGDPPELGMIKQWIDDVFVGKNYECDENILYMNYHLFCLCNNETPYTLTGFQQSIKELGIERRATPTGPRYVGISVAPF